jgi:hypothetical protein
MTDYPLATGSQVHYSPPKWFVLVHTTPERFLSLCPPLRIQNEEEDQYICALAQHIRDGFPLDAPELSFEDHDGRHRATAARIAGVRSLPVYVHPKLEEFVDDRLS